MMHSLLVSTFLVACLFCACVEHQPSAQPAGNVIENAEHALPPASDPGDPASRSEEQLLHNAEEMRTSAFYRLEHIDSVVVAHGNDTVLWASGTGRFGLLGQVKNQRGYWLVCVDSNSNKWLMPTLQAHDIPNQTLIDIQWEDGLFSRLNSSDRERSIVVTTVTPSN